MFRYLIISLVVLSFIGFPVYSSDSGQPERPNVVEIEAPVPVAPPVPVFEPVEYVPPVPVAKPTQAPPVTAYSIPAIPTRVTEPIPVATAIPLPPPVQPEPVKVECIPVEKKEPIYYSNPSVSCLPYAPYEVKVQYTPINPQPYEYSYCTTLPYGCPSGEPIFYEDTQTPQVPNKPSRFAKFTRNCSVPGFVVGVVAYPFKVTGKLIYNVGDWVFYTCKETKHTLLDCNCPSGNCNP